MRLRGAITILAVVVGASIALQGCSAWQHYKASRPAKVAATEQALTQAGFRRLDADQPDQIQIVEGLPSYAIHSYPSTSEVVFWYYDPRYCGCVYVGDENAFHRYDWDQIQQNDTATYVADTEDYDAASLNSLNGTMFPPSLFLLGMAPISGYYGYGGRGGRGGMHGHHHFGGHGGHFLGGGGGGSGHRGGGFGFGGGGDHGGGHGGGHSR